MGKIGHGSEKVPQGVPSSVSSEDRFYCITNVYQILT